MSLDSPRLRLPTVAPGLEELVTLAGLALTILAFGSWLVLRSLALLLSAHSGTAALTFSPRLAVQFLLVPSVILCIASALARHTLFRVLDLALAALVHARAALVMAWEKQDATMSRKFVSFGWLSVHRQQALFIGFTGATGLRVIHWLLSRRRFISRSICRARAALETEHAVLSQFAPRADTAREVGR